MSVKINYKQKTKTVVKRSGLNKKIINKQSTGFKQNF